MISFIKQENTHANRFVIRWEVRKVQTKSAENMGKLVRKEISAFELNNVNFNS